MNRAMVDIKELETWAKSQKRITNRALREHFDLDEEEADACYSYLKAGGIVGSMGYVTENMA